MIGLLLLPDLQLFHHNNRRMDIDIKRRMDINIKLPRKINPVLQNSVNIMLLNRLGRAEMRGLVFIRKRRFEREMGKDTAVLERDLETFQNMF